MIKKLTAVLDAFDTEYEMINENEIEIVVPADFIDRNIGDNKIPFDVLYNNEKSLSVIDDEALIRITYDPEYDNLSWAILIHSLPTEED